MKWLSTFEIAMIGQWMWTVFIFFINVNGRANYTQTIWIVPLSGVKHTQLLVK